MIPEDFVSLANSFSSSSTDKGHKEWVSRLMGTLNQSSGFLLVKGPWYHRIDQSSVQEKPTTSRVLSARAKFRSQLHTERNPCHNIDNSRSHFN